MNWPASTACTPTRSVTWKRQLLDGGAGIFSQNGGQKPRDQEAVQGELFEQIGRLKMELEWVKKKANRLT